VASGRNGVAGTTLRRAGVPEHLLAGEHRQPRDGAKNYVATTAGAGCRLGAAPARAAGADDLLAAYGVLKAEARDARPGHAARTVRAGGLAATHQAWMALLPLVAVLRCSLRGWLNVRSRGKLSDGFRTLPERVWRAYHAPGRRSLGRRMRRLREWAKANVSGAWLPGQAQKPCGRSKEYAKAYAHPGGRRTSSAPGRVMRGMSRCFDDGQHLHGGEAACGRRVRARALLDNYRPWRPAVARGNGGRRCPAERLNRRRYPEGWLRTSWCPPRRAAIAGASPLPQLRDGQKKIAVLFGPACRRQSEG
jgi:hypothetical protein